MKDYFGKKGLLAEFSGVGSTEEVYKDATVRCISRLGGLIVLAQCGRRFDTRWQSALTLPGWVPDWPFPAQVLR